MQLAPPLPEPAARERAPTLSSNGLILYFASDPLGHMDIWRAARATPSSPWGAVENVTELNTEGDEVFAALSADGLSLYFADSFGLPSARAGNLGGADLWVARRTDQTSPWGAPVHLGPRVDSRFGETTPAISADGKTLFFASGNRPGIGEFDLWMATREDSNDPQGWTEAINMGSVINSRNGESGPSISADGLSLYFSSNRPSPGRPGYNNIWPARRKSTKEAFGPPSSLGPQFAAFHGTFDPHIAADGRTLLFTSRGLLGSLQEVVELWQVQLLDAPVLRISRDE